VAYVGSRFVFTAENGEAVHAVHADHVDDRFGKVVAKAPVLVISFQELRHTDATRLLKAGVPVHVVSRRLGYASPAITSTRTATCLTGSSSRPQRRSPLGGSELWQRRLRRCELGDRGDSNPRPSGPQPDALTT
jgi:hypothetical protein